MVYDTLTYHPTIQKLIKFLDTSAGREKCLRLIQYLCRLAAFHLVRNGSVELAAVVRRIQGVVTLDRKALRFLKPLSHLTAASRLYDNELGDAYLRAGAIVKQLGFAAYLSADSLQWFKLLGLVSAKRFPKLAKIASGFWFIALLGSLVQDLRNYQIGYAKSTIEFNEKTDVVEVDKAALRQLASAKRNLGKDVLDALIALNGMGALGHDDGKIGLFGVVTSVMGLQDLWPGN
ncbi:unnamed protein product [Kuraishia capsulata CBS 1993]|uniref:Uncharacterized protein n=1 Tax=Kuraishia capsulata CBS 1993 TaxID=1382522 RepID=W6MHB5_9ASCO|nr:uncharacterized protein KUCA_T00001584001 [Kuraishia capsulata CBS 1993]CDK25614.1 unnamed protein product [Kuraishia capsulata CBS 1993]